MSHKKIKVLIIDDENLAREKIRTFLSREADIEITGECKNATEAISAIKNLKPDLIFLDIKLPGKNAFEMLEELNMKTLPFIVFTTAFDKYAVKAFDVNAVGYLLKPFDKERLEKVLQTARVQIANSKSSEINNNILEALKELNKLSSEKREDHKGKLTERFVIKSPGKIYFIKADDIEWLEASGNYIKIFANNGTHMYRETLSNIEKILDPKKFMRIQRSVIVNLDFIKELKTWFHNEYNVFMKNGTQFTSGRTFKNNIDKIFKN